jgi:hypothetical protein
VARPIEPRDSYASGIRIPHSSPSVKSNSRPHKQFCYRQISPDTQNKRKRDATLQHDDGSCRLGRRQLKGAAAPSASTTPSAGSDLASDGDAVGGSPPRRTTSAPHLGHRHQGLLQESGSSRRLGRPPRGLGQLSPEDISPACGLGNSTPASVPPVDDPARLRPTKSSFRANSASARADTATSGFGSLKGG